jgi:putative transposase
LVDTLGLLLGVVVHCGSIQDAHGAKLVFQSLQSQPRLERLQTIWADGAYGMYGGELVRWVKENYGWQLEVVQKPPEQKGFVVIKKRWVVERTFAWLGKCRRLSKDYEQNPCSSEAWIRLAMIGLMVRRLT